MATPTAAPRCTEVQGGRLETRNIKNTLKSSRWCQSLLVESSFGMRSRVFTRPGSIQDLIFERGPFGVIFLEPFFRGVDVRERLDMFGVADLFACIHVNEHGSHWSLFSLRRPQ